MLGQFGSKSGCRCAMCFSLLLKTFSSNRLRLFLVDFVCPLYAEWLMYGAQHFFQHHFSYIAAASAHIHAFPESLLTSTPYNILSKPLAAFYHITVSEKIERGEEGINSIAMTIIDHRKEIDQAVDRTSCFNFSSLAVGTFKNYMFTTSL